MSGLTAVSLFAGIGGIDRALEVAGIRVVAAVEIDAACRGILARHFPGAALFDDVETVTADDLRAAGFVPGRGILAAGWPCQGNSVAGRRAGMADPRSGLWLHVARLLAELRPCWFLGENVPGLYSVNNGRDIAVVRADLARLGYWWAERILDAQHFGVPQRRNRIFFAGHSGNRAAPVQVLLEPESGARDFAPGGTARARAPGAAENGAGDTCVASALTATYGNGTSSDLGVTGTVVSTLQGGGRRGHRVDAECAAGGHLVIDAPLPSRAVSHAITAREGKGADSDATNGFIVIPVATRGRAGGSQMECGEPGDPAFTLHTREGGSSLPMIAHALTSEGADASEDGTGRSTPIVPVGVPLMAVAAPLTSGSFTGEGVNSPGRRKEDDTNLVTHDPFVFANTAGGTALGLSRPGVPPLTTRNGDPGSVVTPAAVRRLTPRECERLQGFPDDWTRWTADGKEQSDSARYRQLGNAVAVLVAEWICRRIAAFENGSEAAA